MRRLTTGARSETHGALGRHGVTGDASTQGRPAPRGQGPKRRYEEHDCRFEASI